MKRTKAQYMKQEETKSDCLPTCTDYAHFLDAAIEKLKISRDEARAKYGQYTYRQWKELLGLA